MTSALMTTTTMTVAETGLNGLTTTNATITDDVTKTDNASMTSPVSAEEMSANDSTPTTETMTSPAPPGNLSTSAAAETGNSTSYPGIVLATVSPAATADDSEEEKKSSRMSTTFSPSDNRTVAALSEITSSLDGGDENPAKSTG